jgi:WD40 repeat protein
MSPESSASSPESNNTDSSVPVDISPPAGQKSKRRRIRTFFIVGILACLVLISSVVLVYRFTGGGGSFLRELPVVGSLLGGTLTPSPSPTSAEPTPEPIPTPRLSPITRDNAESVHFYQRFGKGRLLQIAFSSDGEHFYAATELGAYRYAISDLGAEGEQIVQFRSPYYENPFWHAGTAGISTDGSMFAIGYGVEEASIWMDGDERDPSWIFSTEGISRFDDENSYYYVTAIEISPNSELLAIGGDDNLVQVWTIPGKRGSRGVLLGELTLNYQNSYQSREWVTSVAFSPDNTLLAVASNLGQISLWRMDDGSLVKALTPQSHAVNALAFSPDNQFLASGSWDGSVRLWDAEDGSLKEVLSVNTGGIAAVAFSPDGKLLAAGSFDSAAYLWETESTSLVAILAGHTKAVTHLAFSPDGRTLATGSVDTTVRFWDLTDGTVYAELGGFLTDIHSLDYSPDDSILAAGLGNGDIHMIRTSDGITANILQGHSDQVNSVAFSPDGKHLASGSSDFEVRIWDAADARLEHILEGHRNAVRQVVYSPDGTLLASGSNDGTVRFWDAGNGSLEGELTHMEGEIETLAFSPDGRLLAAGGDEKTLYLWNVSQKEIVGTWEVGEYYGIGSLAFSPDGKTLAIGSGGKIYLYSIPSGLLLWTYEEESIGAVSLGFLDEGRVIFCGDASNGMACLINTQTGKNLIRYYSRFELVMAKAVNHAGNFMAGATRYGFIEILAVY